MGVGMNEEIFFVIEGKELVLDKVLVEFNEAPIFFVCKSEQLYFIASCVDIENERYLVAQIGLSNLARMLHGKITMRNLILQANLFWDITVREDITKDIVIKRSVETISVDDLPYEGAYLTLATKDLEKYAEKIDSTVYGEGIWENRNSQISDKYIKVDVPLISWLPETTVNIICDIIFKDLMKKSWQDDVQDDVYSKEFCSEGMKISTKNASFEVSVESNGKHPWAA